MRVVVVGGGIAGASVPARCALSMRPRPPRRSGAWPSAPPSLRWPARWSWPALAGPANSSPSLHTTDRRSTSPERCAWTDAPSATRRDATRRAAVRRRARITEGTAAIVADGAVRGVRVDDVFVGANAVIAAAGAWSPQLLEPIGVRVRVAPQRGQIMHLR